MKRERIRKFYSIYKDLQRELIKEINIFFSLITYQNLAAYSGWIGYENLGDELLFEAHKLLFPKYRLIHFRPSPFLKLYFRLFKRSAFKIGILGGGTLINDDYRWLFEMQYIQNQLIPTFCFGTGVSDPTFWEYQNYKKWHNYMKDWSKILKNFSFVGLRGPDSYKILKNNKINNGVIIGDTAISLAPNRIKKKIDKKEKIIGLNIGENPMWGNEEEYFKKIIILIHNLLGKDFKIYLLPISKKDININKRMLKIINNQKCYLNIKAYKSYKEYFIETEKCDIFISQKLHAGIISTMHRIPTIMFEYQPKCRDYMKSIDMNSYVIRTDELDIHDIVSMINEILSKYDNLRSKLDKKIKEYKALQKKYAYFLNSNLL